MHLRKALLFLFVFNSLYGSSNNDQQLIPQNYAIHQGNELPQEEGIDLEIHNAQAVLIDQDSSLEQRTYAKLKLIVYYYQLRNYGRVRDLCLDIISNPHINHGHATYFIGELYLKGRDVEQSYETALRYYQDYLDQEEMEDMFFVGPCSYKSFSRVRIEQIRHILENDAIPA